VSVALAPAQTDVRALARSLSIPVLAQHTDPDDAGARTGFVVPEAIAAAGARGSLVNHSEHRLPREQIAPVLDRLRSLGLVAVLCSRDAAESEELARLAPPYLAVEPPELIGGSVSVSSARPEVVSETVRAVRAVSPGTRVLCGAGVHDTEDVRRALELGSEGILVSSAVARAERPAAVIARLLRGFARDARR
jgi:triosephosphate isomerase